MIGQSIMYASNAKDNHSCQDSAKGKAFSDITSKVHARIVNHHNKTGKATNNIKLFILFSQRESCIPEYIEIKEDKN